ncbi:MAG: TraV family lipoprotein [Gammaproteobacteria bacterium]|nr:TraV family lipoprotein [Gammaproteobacteria bacterium]
MNKTSLILICLPLLAGCSVKGEYTCGIPENGVKCQPMDTTLSQLSDGTLRSLHTEPFPAEQVEQERIYGKQSDYRDEHYSQSAAQSDSTARIEPQQSITTIRSKQAVLSRPRELRIWFNRFTDPDGDLHDESFVFIRIDEGHWLIDDKPVLY